MVLLPLSGLVLPQIGLISSFSSWRWNIEGPSDPSSCISCTDKPNTPVCCIVKHFKTGSYIIICSPRNVEDQQCVFIRVEFQRTPYCRWATDKNTGTTYSPNYWFNSRVKTCKDKNNFQTKSPLMVRSGKVKIHRLYEVQLLWQLDATWLVPQL